MREGSRAARADVAKFGVLGKRGGGLLELRQLGHEDLVDAHDQLDFGFDYFELCHDLPVLLAEILDFLLLCDELCP